MSTAFRSRGKRAWRPVAILGTLGIFLAAGLSGLVHAGEAAPADPGSTPVGEPAAADAPKPAVKPARQQIGAGELGDPGVGDAGGGELLQFEEFPTVVSVTRQASGANVSSVPVGVITDKEIQLRGAMNVPQLFEFMPGMDVIRLDRNRTAIGIRGMFGAINDRILCLVDGDKTADPASGSTNFQNYPLFIEDIQRIEVVRGPSGAAWGANAFYGVINVLTKDPADTQGYFASSTVDQYGDSQTHLRYGGQSGNARWRVSTGYENHVASSVALDTNTAPADAGFTAMTDSRLVIEADPHVKFTFGLSYLHGESDTINELGYIPTLDQNRDVARGFLRTDLELSENLSSTWTASYNYDDERQPAIFSTMSREAALEGQFDYSGFDSHKLSFGGSLRNQHTQAYRHAGQDWQFQDNPNEENWGGLFVVDRYQVNSHAWMELQGRADLFKFSEPAQKGDWSGRAAFIYGLDDSLKHVFRISAARSYRAPSQLLRDSLLKRYPLGGGFYGLNLTPGENLRDETIWSGEAGYTGRVATNWDVQVNAFYNRCFHLISAIQTSAIDYQTANLDGVTGYGGELELDYHVKNMQVKAWYAYAGFHTDTKNVLLRATPPAPNKAGLTVQWNFHPDWNAFLGYRYNDFTPGDSSANKAARAFNQLDLTCTYQIRAIHGELLLGVIDLFNDTSLGLSDIFTDSTPQPTPGRTFVARGQFTF